jgi:hypothetical protein
MISPAYNFGHWVDFLTIDGLGEEVDNHGCHMVTAPVMMNG